MFTCFDLNVTEEETDAAILGGHYVLQAYATTHWLHHVKECIQGDMGPADMEDLCTKIWRFLVKRTNPNFDRKSAKEERMPELKQLEKKQKDLYRELCYINSSLASELSESLKAPKKNSESLFHTFVQPEKSRSNGVQFRQRKILFVTSSKCSQNSTAVDRKDY